MEDLKFKYIRTGDFESMLPINENLKIANELKVTVALVSHLDDFKNSDAYILVKVSEDGERFQNEIIGMENRYEHIILN